MCICSLCLLSPPLFGKPLTHRYHFMNMYELVYKQFLFGVLGCGH